MADTTKNGASSEDILSNWMKISSDFMGAMTKIWGMSAVPGQGATPKSSDTLYDMWTTQFKLWEIYSAGGGDAGGFEAVTKALGTLPDISHRLMQTTLNGFALFQSRWSDRLQKAGASADSYDFSDLDFEFLNRWTETYQQEFQQFLKVPQIGLTRLYQEKLNDTIDQYNLFQAAATEFIHLLTVPVEKSIKVLKAQILDMAEEGTLPQDARQIYRMWIKVLEGHYMTLFQSPEYNASFGKALTAMNKFLAARQEVTESILKTIPVPTNKELDELYREIYHLKKRIRKLENRQKSSKGKK